jgi:hypothetical protein
MISELEFKKLPEKQKYLLYLNKSTRRRIPKNDYLLGNGLLEPLITNGYTQKVKNLLKTYGDDIVKQLIIVRTPLDKYTEMALNAVSLFDFNKTKQKNNYDDYFHLHLNVVLNSGTILTVEKNEVINIDRGGALKNNSEVMPVTNTPPNTSLMELMNKTQVHQGSKYFLYNASSNNCQYFIRDMLFANGVSDPSYIEFVKQDTESIFKGSPYFRKLANTVTSLGAVAHTLNDAIPTNKQINKTINKTIKKSNKTINKSIKKSNKKVKKLFGGSSPYHTMQVKELKQHIKSRKNEFNRKVNITGLKKKDLLALILELPLR